MQVRKLHRLLSEYIAQGHGRKQVMVSKESFHHELESDGVTILPVQEVALREYPIANDDGGFLHDDDQEHFQTSIVLSGGYSPPAEEI